MTPNIQPVPFNYQQSLVGAFHRWLGENELHDGLSLYSLSWLTHGTLRGKHLDFPNGSTFCVSAPDDELLSAMVRGIFKGHQIRWGMEVREVTIQRTPDFGTNHRFLVNSPVLIKRPGEKHSKFYFHDDAESNALLTETLKIKMDRMGVRGEVKVRFDDTYTKPRIKMATYKGIHNKGSICPVWVEGDQRAVQFAWEVGVGSSTGIGFGCLK